MTYARPSTQIVDEALRMMLKPALRRAFFEGLENPYWLEPLDQHGCFSSPPEPLAAADGTTSDTHWPELTYLVKVAKSEPEAVVDILLKLNASENVWVRRAAFTIGSTIPPEQGARLVRLLRAWKSTGFGWRSDPREMSGFAARLLQGGETDEGQWLADVLFRPHKERDSKRAVTTLEDYWYYSELPGFIAALPNSALRLVSSWLNDYEGIVGHWTKDLDLTYMTRHSVAERSGSEIHESSEQALIDGVRDLAVRQGRTDPHEMVSTVLAVDSHLNRKIALHAVAEVLKDDALESEVRLAAEAIAHRLLADEGMWDAIHRIEYIELMRVTPNGAQILPALIARGPDLDWDRWRSNSEGTDDHVRAEQADYVERWKHGWLAAAGTESLNDDLRALLQSYDERYGAINEPFEPMFRSYTWTGPNSPLSIDEMNAMEPSDLADYLEHWHAGPDRFGPEPSHEGQGRELAALLTTNPEALAGVPDLARRLRPTYLRAILQGWEAAVRAGLDLDWSQVGDLVEAVLEHADESPFEPEGREFDDDHSFEGAKRAAVGLLVEVVKPRDDSRTPETALPRFAQLLIESARQERAWEVYAAEPEGSDSDPLTTSLNWQWPERFRGLVYLMSHGTDSDWYNAARTAVDEELARPDHRGSSYAVLGESLGRLLNAGVPWIHEQTPTLFGTRESLNDEQQIALTTTLAAYNYSLPMFDLLHDALLGAIAHGEPLKLGWNTATNPLQRLGSWVVHALIFGHKTMSDDIVSAFFEQTTPETRGGALGNVAWGFANASSVDDAVRDRFGDLWNERIAHVRDHPEDGPELNGFFWVARSERWPAEWWLPRLQEVLALYPAIVNERYMIGKQLAVASHSDPARALAVLKALLAETDRPFGRAWDLSRHAEPTVIASALQSGVPALETEARELMNQLGENGQRELEGEVNKVLRGEPTDAQLED